MYGGNPYVSLPATGAALSAIQFGWIALAAIALVICGVTLYRLAKTSPKRMNS